MDITRDEKRKAWASKLSLEKKPSMKRRYSGHDYYSRCVYLITINVVRGACPLCALLGTDAEHADIRLEASELGRRVTELWESISIEYPQIRNIAFTLMPDHVHGILFVTSRLPRHLGHVIARFKAKSTAAWHGIISHSAAPTQKACSLWEGGFNDRVLRGDGELRRWIEYVRDNPRRRWVKAHHPEYFTCCSGLSINETPVTVMGNRFLLSYPDKVVVRCSRRLNKEEIERECDCFMAKAAEGAVLVSPCISPGEKAVMKSAFDAGFPQIILLENGFAPRQKPSGRQFDACAAGRLLLVAPWEHHNERRTITRAQCEALNRLAAEICDGEGVRDYVSHYADCRWLSTDRFGNKR